jgi:hypothetical protein
VQQIPRWVAQAGIQFNRLSVLSAFSGSRPQGGSLPPYPRGHGRLDVSIPVISPLPIFPVFSHRARFDRLTLYLSTTLSFVSAHQIAVLSPRLSRTPVRHASYAYLHSPHKVHGEHSFYHSTWIATRTTRPQRKLVGKRPRRAPAPWNNYDTCGMTILVVSKCGGSLLCLDVLLTRM